MKNKKSTTHKILGDLGIIVLVFLLILLIISIKPKPEPKPEPKPKAEVPLKNKVETIEFDVNDVFEACKSEFKDGKKDILKTLIDTKVIKELETMSTSFVIERIQIMGHTDSKPHREGCKMRYPTNWLLGADRSIKVLEIYLNNNNFFSDYINSGKLSIGSYADKIKLTDNEGVPYPDNDKKHRRISFRVEYKER